MSLLGVAAIAEAQSPWLSSGRVSKRLSPKDEALSKTLETSVGAQWLDGTFHFQYGTNCTIIGGAYEENMITSYAGYWGRSDATYPAVGDVYLGHVFLSIPGNACADGITDALIYVNLPTATNFYFDSQNQIHCYYNSPFNNPNRNWTDVTNDPNSGCQTNPAFSPGYGYQIAWPSLPTGAYFEVQFPLQSRVNHSGLSDSGSRLLARLSSSDTPNSPSRPNNNPQYPDQWVFVAANPPSVTYPAPATTLITTNSAHTQGIVYNHFASGNVYFDIGTSSSYGTVTGPYFVDGSQNGVYADQDWTLLAPGTPYHWRVRFATSTATVAGADQTFTTSGTPVVVRRRGDFNADGRADLVWRNSSSGTSTVWMMNGTNIGVGSGTTSLQINSSYTVAAVGDFNGDGKADLAWRNNSTGETILWLMDGINAISGSGYLATIPPPWQIVGVGDFNGDTRSDLLWRNATTGENSIWLLNGTAIQAGSGSILTISDTNWTVGGVGDFNQDGRSDILWRNNTTGTSSITMMNGTSVGSGSGSTFLQIGAAWRVAAVADLNGDGYADVLWRNATTGQDMVWLMNGTNTIAGSGETVQVADLNWNVAATGDFNGDGREDLAWRNNATGVSSIWLMNGTSIGAGSGTLLDVPPPWAIAGPK